MDFSDLSAQITEQASAAMHWFADATDGLAALGIDAMLQAYPYFVQFLPQLPEFCALCLALAVLLLARRLRRTRVAMRGALTEIERQQAQALEYLDDHKQTQERLNRLSSEFAELVGRQRALDARIGKPDPKLAAAMARSGTQRQHMVDCGLSHGEVNLLKALSTNRSAGQASAAAA